MTADRTDASASWQAVEAVLQIAQPAEAEVLTALAQVVQLRDEVDRREARLTGLARDAGANWQQIAEALGLRSRQAAEQRAARRQGRARQQKIDTLADPPATALRTRVAALVAHLDRLPRHDDPPGARVRLARRTLTACADAPPGRLYDLARLALGDLDTVPPDRLHGRVARAVERVAALAHAPGDP